MPELKEALTSLDEYGHRINIIPAEVKGFFRKWRSLTQFILIVIFLILPWTKINGHQTLLLDIVNRRFAFFGIQLWSHDGPLIFFVLAILVFGLALVTALWGRVWCGWGCPQTVFIDAIYRRIEILVEGNYILRRQLAKSEMSFNKFFKTLIKWFLFFLVSSVIAHSFVAYFVGADELKSMVLGSPTQNWSYFLLVSAMTFIVLFDFGWFREQFCIVMCPYGRFQSVLLDSHSITVLYDEKRGEPRKASGDCVACNRCVQVCPTGIDIRKGVQMECVACTACIDACDEIMEKVKKPKGLIRYASLRGENTKIFRPRVMIYLVFLLVSVSGLTYGLSHRSGAMITLLRAIETPYQLLKNGDSVEVINHFKLHIHNQTREPQKFHIEPPASWLTEGVRLTTHIRNIELPPLKDQIVHFFVIFPAGILDQKGQKTYDIVITNDLERFKKTIYLVGPENGRN
jgi:cytochrome c oxidase accessory protein FixG